MAAGTAEGDTPMEELVDQGVGMEETAQLTRPLLREIYHSDTLLGPDTDFLPDDGSSAASGMDMVDRLTYLEQRMQMQEDEIQLLKMALSDVLKRLDLSEEHQARRASGTKARPVSLALPSKSPIPATTASLKKSTTLPSSGTARNYSSSPTPSKSSAARSPVGSVKDSPCKTAKTRPTAAAPPTCKKALDSSKAKAPPASPVSLGTRRVTHCKVTMQIYLNPLTRRTGSSEDAKSAPTVPANDGPNRARPSTPQARVCTKAERRKRTPAFSLNLQKTTVSQNSPLDASSYKSPLKSPSQYFQICY